MTLLLLLMMQMAGHSMPMPESQLLISPRTTLQCRIGGMGGRLVSSTAASRAVLVDRAQAAISANKVAAPLQYPNGKVAGYVVELDYRLYACSKDPAFLNNWYDAHMMQPPQ